MHPNVELAERLIDAFRRWDRPALAEIIRADAVIDVSVRVVDRPYVDRAEGFRAAGLEPPAGQ